MRHSQKEPNAGKATTEIRASEATKAKVKGL